MWFEDFDKMFARLQKMAYNDIFEQYRDTPYYYGYTLKIGADGKPEFKEYGNKKLIGHTSLPTKPEIKSTEVDEIVNNDEVKLVLEMAGLEKEDIKVEVIDDLVTIEGSKGEKKYSERIPLKYKVDKNPKASYKNGILEITFKKLKPNIHKVDVE